MALQPCEILVRSRRVYNQQKFLLANSINNQVINDAATLVQQKRVLPGSNIELADVICEHRVEPFARACPIHSQLSHVRNIEDADVVSYGLMLFEDAGVLHRHEPPAEGNDFRAAPHMFVVKRRALLGRITHAASLDFANGVRNAPEIR